MRPVVVNLGQEVFVSVLERRIAADALGQCFGSAKEIESAGAQLDAMEAFNPGLVRATIGSLSEIRGLSYGLSGLGLLADGMTVIDPAVKGTMGWVDRGAAVVNGGTIVWGLMAAEGPSRSSAKYLDGCQGGWTRDGIRRRRHGACHRLRLALSQLKCGELVLTVFGKNSAAARGRSEAALRLFDRAASGEQVDLAALSGMEMCVLGGPKHAVCEESVAKAWAALGHRRREKAKDLMTSGLVERGLLIRESAGDASESLDGIYAMDPGLALSVAARCKPTFVVVTEVSGHRIRTPMFFALGDEEKPVRGIVVEDPAVLPSDAGDFPQMRKLGPLGWLYRYCLVSPAGAADILAGWAISPVSGEPEPGAPVRRVTSLYWRIGAPEPIDIRIVTEGDGENATLFVHDDENPGNGDSIRAGVTLDHAGLREEMSKLLALGVR